MKAGGTYAGILLSVELGHFVRVESSVLPLRETLVVNGADSQDQSMLVSPGKIELQRREELRGRTGVAWAPRRF